MRASTWLRQSTTVLETSGISSARLDCLLLLEDESDKDRAWLLAHPELELDDTSINNLNTKITQRITHIPLSYIRGRSEFYGRNFMVDSHVLEPRPETEMIIAQLLSLSFSDAELTVIDVGTGSGALAITAKLELPQAIVIGTDIDPDCLRVAERNAANLKADVRFVQADLIDNVADRTIDIILANLPYVPDDYEINLAAGYEPSLAIFGGPDGLDLYRRLFKQLLVFPARPHYVITESLPVSHTALSNIAQDKGYSLVNVADFIQIFKRA